MPTKVELEDSVEQMEALLTDLQSSLGDLLYDVRALHDERHDANGEQPWPVCPDPVCQRFNDVEGLRDAIDTVLA